MRRWNYGINAYHRTCSIYLYEAPAAYFWLDDLVESICEFANRLPRVPLIGRIPVRDPETGAATTLGEYYGDLPGDWFHRYVHCPIFDWLWNGPDSRIRQYAVDMDWETARARFYERDREFWDAEERQAAELKAEQKDDGEGKRDAS